jgi:hypothetical protein
MGGTERAANAAKKREGPPRQGSMHAAGAGKRDDMDGGRRIGFQEEKRTRRE